MNGIDLSKYKPVTPTKATKQSFAAFLGKERGFSKKTFGDKKKQDFYLELSILLESGIDIKSALELIGTGDAHQKENELITRIKDTIIAGSSLSQAMIAADQFSAYEYFSVQIGEETGKIVSVLKELSLFFKKKLQQKRQIIAALTYPCIVLATSLGAIVFMMNTIVPMFADVFRRFGGDLPFITLLVLNTSSFIQTYFYAFIALIATGIVLFYRFRKTERWRKTSAAFLLKVPLLGTIMHKMYLARFSQSMTLLTGAKIPLIRALELVKQMIGFYPIEHSLQAIQDKILRGASLHASMQDFPVYPQKMIALIKVGEEVNQLELFFDKIARQYNEDIEHQTAIISSLLEPFIIIFLGVIVGLILVAMYLPLFNLSTTFH